MVMSLPSRTPLGGAPRSATDWGACLAAHEDWLRKVILARTGEAQAVEEVFQQVALAAVEQKSPLADPAKAAPWLHRIAVIQSARYRRKLGRERKAVRAIASQQEQGGNGAARNPLTWLIAKERHEQTRLAMARLRGADAEILLLKYGERWSCQQIAARLGITEKAVDARLSRARTRLRRELTALGIDEVEP
jgi:RNA polymerase sigma-70 factor (ECF subfamily)